MKLISWRSKLKEVKEHYQTCSHLWNSVTDLQLRNIDPDTATKLEVVMATGTRSWVIMKCDECGEDTGEVVQLGEEPDYESATAKICKSCLQQALALFP